MPAYVNFAAIGATSFRSDALGPLDSIAHPLSPGEYRGEVWRGDEQTGSFAIEVGEGGDGEQIEIDLCSVGTRAKAMARFRGGSIQGQPVYAVFHCEGERNGLHVVLRRGTGEGSDLFDSRALQPGDYYIVTPVRPGEWAMTTGPRCGGSGTLTVTQARAQREARASSSGAMIRVDGESFDPARAEVVSGDGAVFEITGRDVAIALALATPPREKGPRKVGVRIVNPAARADIPPDRDEPKID